MRKYWRQLLVITFGGLPLLLPSLAFADTISETGQQITIQATVAPERFVVVSNDGVIQRVISNNTLPDSDFQVYKNTVNASNQIPMTPALLQQTQTLLKGKTMKIGVVYAKPLIAKNNGSSGLTLLPIFAIFH